MSYQEFINKIRHYDNLTAKWIMRNVYFSFFQVILAVIFFVWLFNTIQMIDVRYEATQAPLLERILIIHLLNTCIIVLLLILSSFWTLFIFNSIQRLRHQMKDVSYHLGKMHGKTQT